MRPGLPFDQLLDLATRERDSCAKRLAEAAELARRAADRLRLLKDHFAACAAKGAHARSIDGAQIRNERAFLARLEMAIVRQSEEAQACEQRGEQARAAVNAAERRLRAFGQLQNRADRALALVENKRDQDRNDEFAARRHRDAH
jgi:flagellar protein FliJ